MVPYEGGFCVPLKGWESPRCRYHTGVIKIASGDESKSRLLGLFSRLEKKKVETKQQSVALAPDLVSRHIVVGGGAHKAFCRPPLL